MTSGNLSTWRQWMNERMDEDNGYLGETEATLYCLQNEFPVA